MQLRLKLVCPLNRHGYIDNILLIMIHIEGWLNEYQCIQFMLLAVKECELNMIINFYET